MSKTASEFRPQLIAAIFLVFISSVTGFAQTPIEKPVADPVPSPSPSLERQFFKNILVDQRAIWLAPFSIHKSDKTWLVPLTLSSAALFAIDHRSAIKLEGPGDHRNRLRMSANISRGGSLAASSGVAGAFYLVGRATGNQRARETGLLSMEALIDSEIITIALKTASQRPRPAVDDASGEFFDKGSSFPSGHAANVWSVATVIAHEYGPRRPLVRWAAYGLATAVSISRYTGQKHFLSDVMVGSVIGYGVGRYVYKTHHDRLLDGANRKPSPVNSSKLIPLAYPIYSRTQRTYGLALSWQL